MKYSMFIIIGLLLCGQAFAQSAHEDAMRDMKTREQNDRIKDLERQTQELENKAQQIQTQQNNLQEEIENKEKANQGPQNYGMWSGFLNGKKCSIGMKRYFFETVTPIYAGMNNGRLKVKMPGGMADHELRRAAQELQNKTQDQIFQILEGKYRALSEKERKSWER